MSDMLQLVVTEPTPTVVEIEGICLARHDKLQAYRTLRCVIVDKSNGAAEYLDRPVPL